MLKIKRDLHAGIFLFASSLIIFFFLIPQFVEQSTASSMSPRFFPKFATIIMGVLSLGLILRSWKALKLGRDDAEPADQGNAAQPVNRSWLSRYRPFVIIGLLIAYFIGFEHIGFLWATPVVTAALMVSFGERSPKVIIATCVVVTTVLFFLFEKGLNVPLT